MQRRLDLFDKVVDKGLILAIFWYVLMPTTAFAFDVPRDLGLAEAPKTAPGPNPGVFPPLTRVCKCTSPRVKTGILLLGVPSICYSAFCSKDKSLIIVCSSIATYATTKLSE